MPRVTPLRLLTAPQEWDRRGLQVLLGLAVLVAAAVTVGVAWSVRGLLGGGHDPADGAFGVTNSERHTGRAVPPPVTLDDARPGALSPSRVGTITLPPPARLGDAQVATGFPRTTEGALAQLVAIDQRALQSASVVTAQEVIASWAEPGGPTPRTWSGVEAVTVLLSSAGLPADGDPDLRVVLRPAMGFIMGSVGDGVVIPCVDFVVTVSAGTAPPGRIAAADCQRMVWRAGRWVIGAGAEPAASPSLWPGTQASYDAGYQWLEVGP